MNIHELRKTTGIGRPTLRCASPPGLFERIRSHWKNAFSLPPGLVPAGVRKQIVVSFHAQGSIERRYSECARSWIGALYL